MKNKLMWFYYSWASIMNLKYNPIGYIRDTSLQMYFMTTLSIAWTLVFCAYIAGWLNIVPLLLGHVLFLFAVFFTYGIFEDAKRDRAEWFQDWEENFALAKAWRVERRNGKPAKWG